MCSGFVYSATENTIHCVLCRHQFFMQWNNSQLASLRQSGTTISFICVCVMWHSVQPVLLIRVFSETTSRTLQGVSVSQQTEVILLQCCYNVTSTLNNQQKTTLCFCYETFYCPILTLQFKDLTDSANSLSEKSDC